MHKFAYAREVAVGFVGALTVFSILSLSPGVFSDPAWNILAAQKYLLGLGPYPLGGPWAPAYHSIPLIFKSLSLNWGWSIKLSVLLAWAIGTYFWWKYFRMVLDRLPALALLGFFLSFRYSHSNAYQYDGGEAFVWMVLPIALFLNAKSMPSKSQAWGALAQAFFTGFLSVIFFLVKYSFALVSVGIGATWAYRALRAKSSWKIFGAWIAGATVAGTALLLMGYPRGWNATHASDKLVSAEAVLFPISLFGCAVSDVDSLFRRILLYPSSPLLTERQVIFVGLIFTLLLAAGLAVLIRDHRRRGGPLADDLVKEACLHLTIFVSLVLPAALIVINARGGAVSASARHLRGGAMALLPFAFGLVCFSLGSTSRFRKGVAIALGVAVFLVPAVYGLATMIDKTFFRPSANRNLVSEDGIVLFGLGSEARAKEFYREVRQLAREKDSVLYVPAPDIAIGFADKNLLVSQAEFETIENLAKQRYPTSPTTNVLIVAPNTLGEKKNVIRDSFIDVREWFEYPVQAAPGWVLLSNRKR